VIVCHCHAVSDRDVRRAAQAGAMTVREVARECRAGSGCGGCTRAVREIIEAVHGTPCPGPALTALADSGLSLGAG
jgi:bacterioferritin-associated ferredoxin